MRAVDIIIKKRDGGELSTEEIKYFVNGFTSGEIQDYQTSALAMAILLKGMTPRETADLTLAMVETGDQLDLSSVVGLAVDKHSTGGVGDKTTLVVEPVIAACGVPFGKMSGRGLGFSGGTLDKMESIPGFRVDLNQEEFLKQLDTIGLVLSGQTGDLAPADGKLYALRDVTGTVASLPLIASSIMSKKIAAGAHRIVLDVKTGVGAFMETADQARELAEMMVEIGRLAGRKTVALISDMNQPLGQAVGNALELVEAINTLQGNGPVEFREHATEVAAYLLVLAERAADVDSARQMIDNAISSGGAWKKFRELVIAQGGDVSFVDNPEKLPTARLIETVNAPRSGYLSEVNARIVGETSVAIGAGREKKGQPIDHAVGIEIYHNVGDKVEAGQPLFTIHANQETALQFAREQILKAHQWSDTPVDPLPLFYDVVM